MSLFDNGQLEVVQDDEAIQAVALAAAVRGEGGVRAALPDLLSAFEEPYRTVATVVAGQAPGAYLDGPVLVAALGGRPLYRRGTNGQTVPLAAAEVVNLILATKTRPAQPAAYVGVLKQRLADRRRAEFRNHAKALVEMHADDPAKLVEEIRQAAPKGGATTDAPPDELAELIPYVTQLAQAQQGADYLGLDSGFPHLNALVNGLDTGLGILAAPPGRGKTSLLFQVACQAAKHNGVPVVFVSYEQSKEELRAKAIARLSGLKYRHVLKGRLQSTDPHDIDRLLDGATKYSAIARHMTIVEGDRTTTLERIAEFAKAKKAEAGADRCFVCVDYLQHMPPSAAETSVITCTKDKVDLHVTGLRQLARELKSPVWAIASENRASYGSKSLDVFKESGNIEYAADLAMILTKDPGNGVGGGEFAPLQLNVAKNRNGERGVIRFKFYADRMEFIEVGRDTLPEEDDG